MAELKRWLSYLLIFFLGGGALCSKTDIQQVEKNTKRKKMHKFTF